ncbi:hypothetical protein GPECTOR_35g949 [Gonium pectorale]|uniref:FHA domain-containing protein n=1 Tax=Gonium pectorale TaxID=33097 RepID=A0A150GCD3_GONPE|nr:hypothetical protein GPECTOR_35g949 [Gonium pectorale]|eukprot:KXZ47511.1 hypothetical protein GPECTOR_35g949 [Gonium pectorale]
MEPCEPSTSAADFSIAVPPKLLLNVTQGPCKGQHFDSSSVNSFCLQVGRVKKAKIYFKDNAVSEKHAEVSWDGAAGGWTLEPQTLRDVTLEALLRAHCESRCQAIENKHTRDAQEMVRRCHEALDALLPAPA